MSGGRHAEAADIKISAAIYWFDVLMPTKVQGSEAQKPSHYLFRMSRSDKERLKRRAAAAGMSIQAYLECTALGYETPVSRPPGRPRQHEATQEPFDLSA